ncbi:ABC transporter permease [Streptomyces candidus]|uniref:Glycine betaine/proline transport system permease protein n=1 Tax=Streptomyces candidus TaxID=67283 RepID=A0A7X0HCF1_9ACTN|nr:ABC transporter permease subunit [Streptomyces candidus]MBB6435024.1 glycine betaine/proline transport system permease protein [Streptomyces candidus]GHH40999.1 glycine/betaine ABC transporter permease [Streptomyces candidus]
MTAPTISATARDQREKPSPADGRPAPAGKFRTVLHHRAGRKLLPLAVAVLVLLPLGAALWGGGGWPAAQTVDVSGPLDDANDWVLDNRDTHPLFLYFLLHLSNSATSAVDAVYAGLAQLGWVGVTAGAVLLAWRAGGLGRSGLKVAATALAAFAVCGALGMWDPTLMTIALMIVAVAAASLVGVVLGLAAGLSDRFDRILRPVLDTMQVLPAFAYLLPFVLVFGTGTPAALLCTVIYAAPPMARLTALGMRGADAGVLEAATSLGSNGWQRLRTARLPLARKEMLLGLNQTIMMALSMVVIAALVGAGGLGEEVYSALSTVDVGKALAAGIPIVLIAIWLDRTTAAAGDRIGDSASSAAPSGRGRFLHGRWAWALVAAGTVAAAVAGRLAGARLWPEAWTYGISTPVNKAQEWITENLSSGVPVLGGTEVWSQNFTLWVLNPLHDGLTWLPWWALLLLVAGVAWLVGTWGTALTATLAMAGIGVLGVWDKSLNTLSQVLAALVVTLVIGFAVGIMAARARRFERVVRPVLDAMQTMPQFVYLIPVVALFGVTRASAIIAAVVYALPAVIRITTQGLREVDPAAMEASRSLGAGSRQQLLQVQLPLARPALQLAVNQGVVLVLAVVVVGGLVGGGALGYDVVKGLSRGEMGIGMTAGAAIVCLGLVLDRLTQPAKARARKGA